MKATFTVALAFAICLGTTAALVYTGEKVGLDPNPDARLATATAYVGRLAAESGRPMRPLIGRWAPKKIAPRSFVAIASATTRLLPPQARNKARRSDQDEARLREFLNWGEVVWMPGS